MGVGVARVGLGARLNGEEGWKEGMRITMGFRKEKDVLKEEELRVDEAWVGPD